jgi:hypothetical protein
VFLRVERVLERFRYFAGDDWVPAFVGTMLLVRVGNRFYFVAAVVRSRSVVFAVVFGVPASFSVSFVPMKLAF